MNDTIDTVEQAVPFVTDIRIIEGNDTDGETNVIHVAPEAEEVPVDVSASATTVH